LKEFDRALKRRENEELRRKRLAYVGISLDNVLPNKEKDAGASGKCLVCFSFGFKFIICFYIWCI
jgi:hypothetical protein